MDGAVLHQNFHSLLIVPESGHVILPSELTGVSCLTERVFKAEREYGQCCMLFRMGKTHWISMPRYGRNQSLWFCCTTIKEEFYLFVSWTGWSETSISKLNSQRVSANHAESARVPARIPTSTVSIAAATQGSPRIPEDFEVMQP